MTTHKIDPMTLPLETLDQMVSDLVEKWIEFWCADNPGRRPDGAVLNRCATEVHEAIEKAMPDYSHAIMIKRIDAFAQAEPGRVPGGGVGVGRPGSSWRVGPLLFMRPRRAA